MKFLLSYMGNPVKNYEEKIIDEAIIPSLKLVRRNVLRISRILPWNVKCFPQALTAKILLKKLNIESFLFLGLNKEEQNLNAHAWLKVGNITITGEQSAQKFTSVGIFK